MYRELIGLISAGKAKKTCPVCGKAAFREDDHRTGTLVICGVCGKFRYGPAAQSFLDGAVTAHEADLFYRLSFHLRTISERAWGKKDNSFFPMYSGKDFDEMQHRPDLTIPEKTIRLLRYLGSITEYPGQLVQFSTGSDYSVLNAKIPMEADFYRLALHEEGLIAFSGALTGVQTQQLMARFGDENGFPLTVKPKGWEEILRAEESGTDSANAFVAMWFDASRAPFFQAIERAVANAGYIPVRIDNVHHLNRIDDEIIAQIRRARFMIADFTGQRGGVYFEAGFMLGLGRQVVWLCEKSQLREVHFDTRQYNFIDYGDVADLEHRLQMRIEAIFGKGPRL